jgi:hypothetical protein
MRVLAIDFGTSNTVAMIRTSDGRMRPLLFDGSPLLPSAVYLNTDGRTLVGRDAERHARLDPSRFEPNPKRRIDDGQIFLGDRELPVPQVFSQVLAQVVGEARRQLGGPPQEARLTHPARWGERRRSLLVEAARLAGLGNPRLIAEPVGAASYFTAVHGAQIPVGRSLAIYDLGGGTFDATVVRRTRTGFEVLAEEGLADVGGLDFDHAIVEHLGKTYQASHPQLWAQLANPTDAGDRRHRRLLYEDVRGAKEMLSRTSSADIHLPALEVDAHLTRDELEGMVRPYLERTVECLRRTVDSARLTPTDLVGIFLVGGSSRIPLAAHLIHSELGLAPTTLEQPETVVVEGALCIGVARPAGGGHSGVPRTVAPPMRPAGPQRPVSGQPAAGPVRPPQPQPMQQPMQQPMPPAAMPGVRPTSGGPVTPARPGQPVQPMPGQPGGPVQPMPGQPVQPIPGQPIPGQPRPGQPMQPQPMPARPAAGPMAGPMAGPAAGHAGPPVAGPPGTGTPARPVPHGSPQTPPGGLGHPGPAARPATGPQTPPGGMVQPPRPMTAPASGPPGPAAPQTRLSQPLTAPQGNRPTSGPPAAAPPISSPPMSPPVPPVRPGPQPPQLLRPQPPVARPVAPPVQVPTPVPVQARQQAARQKHWYSEPVVIGTVIVLLLVILLFVALLTTAFSG